MQSLRDPRFQFDGVEVVLALHKTAVHARISFIGASFSSERHAVFKVASLDNRNRTLHTFPLFPQSLTALSRVLSESLGGFRHHQR